MILVKNGGVFAPEAKGICDILIGGNSILHVDKSINSSALPGDTEILDATGLLVTPGFIDGHQHFTGGGGEGGFHTRTPEMSLSMNIDNGVTTAIGLLGTDAHTRSVESLFAKTEALDSEGITTFMLTGSYWLPSPTITGSIARDLCFIKPVIGLKIALADNRGATFSGEELAKVASEVRNSSLIAGKPGNITAHIGAEKDRLSLIFDVVDNYKILANMFIATHVNRKDKELERQALELAQRGAWVDATCLNYSPTPDDKHQSATEFICNAEAAGLFDKVSFSSDAGGSLPRWDQERKNIIGMDIGTPASLRFELNQLVNVKHMAMAKALRPFTTTPAQLYGLGQRKGILSVGYDADILLLDPHKMSVSSVIAKGKILKKDNQLLHKGYFEQ